MNLLSETTQNSDLLSITSLLNQPENKSDFADVCCNSFEKVFDDINDFNNICTDNYSQEESYTEGETSDTVGNDIVYADNTVETEKNDEDILQTPEYNTKTEYPETINDFAECTDEDTPVIKNSSAIEDVSVSEKETVLQKLSDIFVSEQVVKNTELYEYTKEVSDYCLNTDSSDFIRTSEESYANENFNTSQTTNNENIDFNSKDVSKESNLYIVQGQSDLEFSENTLADVVQKEVESAINHIEKIDLAKSENKKEIINLLKETDNTTSESDTIKNNKAELKSNDGNTFKTENNIKIPSKDDILNTNNTNNDEKIATINKEVINKLNKMTDVLKAEITSASEKSVLKGETLSETSSENLTEDNIGEVLIKTQITKTSGQKTADIKDKLCSLNLSEETEQTSSDMNDLSFENDTSEDTNVKLSEESLIAKKSVLSDTESISDIKIPASESISKTLSADKIPTKSFIQNTKTDVLNQVTSKFEQLKDGTTTKLNIVLRPENLGKVSVELVSRADGISARILADTQQVKELLDKNIDALRNTLQTQGINVNNITVKAVENTQNSEFNTAHNFDFSDEQNQQRNNNLTSESDDNFENKRKYDSEEENRQLGANEKEEENINELREAERIYSKHSGNVDLVV